MKKLILPILAVALLCGCANLPPGTALSRAIAGMNATLPYVVAVVTENDSSTVKDFGAAAAVIDKLAGGTNTTPAQLLAAVKALGLNKNAELAIVGGVAVWQLYVSQYPTSTTADAQLFLTALAADLRAGIVTPAKALKAKLPRK